MKMKGFVRSKQKTLVQTPLIPTTYLGLSRRPFVGKRGVPTKLSRPWFVGEASSGLSMPTSCADATVEPTKIFSQTIFWFDKISADEGSSAL